MHQAEIAGGEIRNSANRCAAAAPDDHGVLRGFLIVIMALLILELLLPIAIRSYSSRNTRSQETWRSVK